MRTVKRVVSTCLCLVLLFGCIAACNFTTDSSGKEWQSKLNEQYEKLLPDLGIRSEEWESELKKCNEEEKRIMQYYFITTSMSDLCSIDFSLLRSYASHAAKLRKEMPWTRDLDEDTFLCYVASYQAFMEPIVDYRPFFYDQLADIVKNRSLTEAVLLVNLWCGEQATYSESDQREASPLGMYRGGFGRCGEEACFVVNTLRSVGIPARVCNIDWTVVADGHSLPQVLIDGKWHVIGACEPEPALDSGWFTDRLGSILTTQSISKSDIGIGQDANFWGGFYFVNDIASFTDTKDITITVLDKEGKPAPDTEIDLVLMQPELLICEEDTVATDSEGKARFTIGCGSISAVAHLDGDWRIGWIEKDQTEMTISFADKPENNMWYEYPVRYDEAEFKNAGTSTDEDKKALFGDKDFNEVRKENHAGDFDPSRAASYPDCEESLQKAGKNFDELMTFLERDDNPMRSTLIAGLSDKYLREVNADTLEDILTGASGVRGDLSDEDFEKGLLFPVTEWSYFAPQRVDVQNMLKEDLSKFKDDPASLYRWFCDSVNDECIRDIPGRIPDLYPALRMGYCPEKRRMELLMELARTVGIPVYMDEETGLWNYLGKNGWTVADWAYEEDVLNDDTPYGRVNLLFADNESYLGKYWAVIEVTDNNEVEYKRYGYIEEDDINWEIDLPVGDYEVLLLDMYKEREGTIYMNRLSVDEGGTISVELP